MNLPQKVGPIKTSVRGCTRLTQYEDNVIYVSEPQSAVGTWVSGSAGQMVNC